MLNLRPDEFFEDLNNNIKIIQNKKLYCFSEDPILLAGFTDVNAGNKVLDLGTGSGILLFLLYIKESDIEALGIEIQPSLADMASRSVKHNNLCEKIKILQGDLKKIDKYVSANSWDLVVSNPPYIPLDKGRISPKKEIAAARQEVYCKLSDIISSAAFLLRRGGVFNMIHRAQRLPEIMNKLKENKLYPHKLQMIASHEKKDPFLVLINAVKDISTDFKVLPQINLISNRK